MKTCETCAHWCRIDMSDEYESPSVETFEDGRFRKERAKVQWGYCGEVSEITIGSHEVKFYVRDASEYQAKLGTRFDFGCTEHSEGQEDK